MAGKSGSYRHNEWSKTKGSASARRNAPTEEDMDDPAKACKKAMHLLERMDRTETELRDKLLEKGFTEEAVEEAVRYVRSYGYIDDERYARHYISYHKQSRSIKRMQFELRNKGIPDELIENAMEEASRSDERNLLERLILKRIPDPLAADPKEIEKCKAYLYRQGFLLSDIISAMEKIVSEAEKDTGTE